MTVKNQTITKSQEQVEDDVSDTVIEDSNMEGIEEDKLAALKAKLAKKNKVEDEVRAAVEKNEKEEKQVSIKIVEKKKRSILFGCVGSGQAGGRIVESMFKLGYPSICLNTAEVDLTHINIPEDNKFLMQFSLGGSAKDRELGKQAIEAYREDIASLISDKLANAQMLLLATSLGGGSGSGSASTIIDLLSTTGKPIAVIAVLPMTTDDAQTKFNALQALSELSKLVQLKKVANLIVVDNAKIESIYSNVGQMDFFRVSNEAIVNTIDVFNRLSSQPSPYKSLDPQEFARLFSDGEGLTIYSEMTVNNYAESETTIAEAIINNLDNSLLASGFQLNQAKYAGVMVVGNEQAWKNINSASINYGMALIQEHCPQSLAVFRGLYVDNTISEDIVKIYSMFSGLGLPNSKIEELRKQASDEMNRSKTRDQNRNLNLQLDTGVDETTNQADKVRDMIKNKNSTFNKNFAGIKDFRRK